MSILEYYLLLLLLNIFGMSCIFLSCLRQDSSAVKHRSQQIVRLFLSRKIYKIVFRALSCEMSKTYFEWSHQLRHVHDDSTMGTRQEKKCNSVLSRVCRKTIVRQSYGNRELFGLYFRFSCHGMCVLLSCHCLATVVQLTHNIRGSLARLTPNY